MTYVDNLAMYEGSSFSCGGTWSGSTFGVWLSHFGQLVPMPFHNAIELLRNLPQRSRGIVDQKIPVDCFEQLSQ